MKIPITQSREWQKLQDDLGEQSFFEKTEDYQYLAIKKHTPVGNYLYCPYGPVYDDEAGLQLALNSLNDLAREHHAIFVRIEPRDPDFSKQFKNIVGISPSAFMKQAAHPDATIRKETRKKS